MKRHTSFVLAGILLALLLALPGGPAAEADSPGNAPVTFLPGGGQAGNIELRTQTVDANVSREGDMLWAETRVMARLANNGPEAAAIKVSLPGPQVVTGTIPADLKLTLDDEPLTTEAADAGWVASFSIGAKSQVELRASYRQSLPETQGLVSFIYPLAAAAKWAGKPESLRVTVNFASPIPAEEILGQSPEADAFDGQSLTWQFADVDPDQNVGFAFMTPAWWSQFSDARDSAAQGGGAQAQIALSRLYQQLAALPRPAFLPDADFYERYYPAAVAALQAATQAGSAGGAQPADIITAHTMLLSLYREQAARLGDNGGDVYLDLAAAEAQAALSAGATDPALSTLAADTYRQLAARARARGDTAAADSYLARLATLDPNNQASADDRRTARLAAAAEQAARGDVEAARDMVTEDLGPAAAEAPDARPPLARQALVTVQTDTGHRSVRMVLADSRDPAALTELLAQAAGAWKSVTDVEVSSGPDWLAAGFAFASDANLAEVQKRLVAATPNEPELALLTAALAPIRVTLPQTRTFFSWTQGYAEEINLRPANQHWEGMAAKLETAVAGLAATSEQATGAEAELSKAQQALWTTDAAAWRALAANSTVQYAVRLDGDGSLRQWQAPAGATRTLSVQASGWFPMHLFEVVVAGALLLLVISVIIWRLG